MENYKMTKYFVTIGDYNDVFLRDEIDFKSDIEAEKYAINKLLDFGYTKDQIEDIGQTNICYGVYLPVTDESGNPVFQEDPRYEKLSQEQDLRLDYYVELEEDLED